MNTLSAQIELPELKLRREPIDAKWRHVNRNTRKGRAGIGNRTHGAARSRFHALGLRLLPKKSVQNEQAPK